MITVPVTEQDAGGRPRSSSVLRYYAGTPIKAMNLGTKIIVAVARWAASIEQDQFNGWIRAQMNELGIEDEDPSFNYYGYLENVFSRMGMRGANLDEAVTDTMGKMFAGGAEGTAQTPFESFQREGGPQGKVPFHRFFQHLAKGRANSKLRDDIRHKGKLPGQSMDMALGEDSRATLSDIIPGAQGAGAEAEFSDLMNVLKDTMARGDETGDQLKVFQGLIDGKSSREIRKELSKPSGRYFNDVRNSIKDSMLGFFRSRGLTEVSDQIEKMMGLDKPVTDDVQDIDNVADPTPDTPPTPAPSAPSAETPVTLEPESPAAPSPAKPKSEGGAELPAWLKSKTEEKRQEYFKKFPRSKYAPKEDTPGDVMASRRQAAGGDIHDEIAKTYAVQMMGHPGSSVLDSHHQGDESLVWIDPGESGGEFGLHVQQGEVVTEFDDPKDFESNAGRPIRRPGKEAVKIASVREYADDVLREMYEAYKTPAPYAMYDPSSEGPFSSEEEDFTDFVQQVQEGQWGDNPHTELLPSEHPLNKKAGLVLNVRESSRRVEVRVAGVPLTEPAPPGFRYAGPPTGSIYMHSPDGRNAITMLGGLDNWKNQASGFGYNVQHSANHYTALTASGEVRGRYTPKDDPANWSRREAIARRILAVDNPVWKWGDPGASLDLPAEALSGVPGLPKPPASKTQAPATQPEPPVFTMVEPPKEVRPSERTLQDLTMGGSGSPLAQFFEMHPTQFSPAATGVLQKGFDRASPGKQVELLGKLREHPNLDDNALMGLAMDFDPGMTSSRRRLTSRVLSAANPLKKLNAPTKIPSAPLPEARKESVDFWELDEPEQENPFLFEEQKTSAAGIESDSDYELSRWKPGRGGEAHEFYDPFEVPPVQALEDPAAMTFQEGTQVELDPSLGGGSGTVDEDALKGEWVSVKRPSGEIEHHHQDWLKKAAGAGDTPQDTMRLMPPTGKRDPRFPEVIGSDEDDEDLDAIMAGPLIGGLVI